MWECRNLPPQQLPFNKKNKEWRKKHLDWADHNTYYSDSAVRKSVLHKVINYDLLRGVLHMEDLKLIINPDSINASYIPEQIQHYPIMNSKLNVLSGEEIKRGFYYKAIVTNPNQVSEIENNKKEEYFNRLKELVSNTAQSEEDFNSKLEELDNYYTYDWQDIREIRANALLKHYSKELSFPIIFNQGFTDAMAVGEEIYQCRIVGGEPTLERINPTKIRVFKSGFSNKIEDADIIILEDFWNLGRIIDTYFESLTNKDVKYIETISETTGSEDEFGLEEKDKFVFIGDVAVKGATFGDYLFGAGGTETEYFDSFGNIRVLRIYWKSRRKIKKVTSFDPNTGEEVINFYPETYKINPLLGETEKTFWINEAWEGTKIGKDIYVEMRPRTVQYNRLSNPSRCHFGIVGSIYNLNDGKPFSLVDMMKPYNYMYNSVHDRLNKTIASNWGKILELDLASVPKGWEIEKWLYFAKVNHLAIKDSFKEGNTGAAMGKLSGAYAANSRGVIDAEVGNNIQSDIQLLEFLKEEMSEIVGISRQREGQISNKETVGGIERATLQSSHITEWLFTIHDDTKKRAIECFIETAKMALLGRSKKFPYILSDNSIRIMDIPGDEFAECDYGIVIDSSSSTQELRQKLQGLAQAALQNQSLSFSTIMKIYSTDSIAETERLIEKDEKDIQQRQQQAQQEQLKTQQQIAAMQAQTAEAERDQKDLLNQRDNETKILIEQMKLSSSVEDGINPEETSAELLEKIRQFDAKHKLDRDKFNEDKRVKQQELDLKNKQLNIQNTRKNENSKK